MASIEVDDRGITKLTIDAITNAANGQLLNLGGVAKAIADAGGAELEKECRAIKTPIPVGTAVHTSAGDMRPHVKWVIHAVTMDQPGGHVSAESVVRDCTVATLACADQLGAKSLALVAFGTGVGGFPIDRAAQIEVEAVRKHAGGLNRVVFAIRTGDAAAAAAFKRALAT